MELQKQQLHNENEFAFGDGTALRDDSFESDLMKFVGKKYPYYDAKWQKSKDNKPAWNFAAFFFSAFWLGYRKMYMPLAIMIGLFFLIDLILFLFNYQYDPNTWLDAPWTDGFQLVLLQLWVVTERNFICLIQRKT